MVQVILENSGDDNATTSNNDGAACHAGDPTVTFTPHIDTPTQGSAMGLIVKLI